jgi:hypothetical protein
MFVLLRGTADILFIVPPTSASRSGTKDQDNAPAESRASQPQGVKQPSGEFACARPKAGAGDAGLSILASLQRFVSTFSALRNHFVPPRFHRSALTVHLHRLKAMAEWTSVTAARP